MSTHALAISICFFFSSRRRHTRFDCDWSSDVCSSDLFRIAAAESDPTQRLTRGDEIGGHRMFSSTGSVDAKNSVNSREVSPRSHEEIRSEEHTSELQSQSNLVCRLLLEKKKTDVLGSSARITGLLVNRAVTTRRFEADRGLESRSVLYITSPDSNSSTSLHGQVTRVQRD